MSYLAPAYPRNTRLRSTYPSRTLRGTSLPRRAAPIRTTGYSTALPRRPSGYSRAAPIRSSSSARNFYFDDYPRVSPPGYRSGYRAYPRQVRAPYYEYDRDYDLEPNVIDTSIRRSSIPAPPMEYEADPVYEPAYHHPIVYDPYPAYTPSYRAPLRASYARPISYRSIPSRSYAPRARAPVRSSRGRMRPNTSYVQEISIPKDDGNWGRRRYEYDDKEDYGNFLGDLDDDDDDDY